MNMKKIILLKENISMKLMNSTIMNMEKKKRKIISMTRRMMKMMMMDIAKIIMQILKSNYPRK